MSNSGNGIYLPEEQVQQILNDLDLAHRLATDRGLPDIGYAINHAQKLLMTAGRTYVWRGGTQTHEAPKGGGLNIVESSPLDNKRFWLGGWESTNVTRSEDEDHE